MDRDEFTALPLAIALGLVWDIAGPKLKAMPAPKLPLPPKYDGRQSKDGGFCWFSEMALADLEYWRDKNAKGAADGGQYADSNRKKAEVLGKWVEWRRVYPGAQWRGVRGDDKAPSTAARPSRDPTVNAWPDKDGKGGKGGKAAAGTSKRGAPPPEDTGPGWGF